MSQKFTALPQDEQQPREFRLHTAKPVATKAIEGLIDNISEHIFQRNAAIKSNGFLKNEIMKVEVDSIKQLYQQKPFIPKVMIEENLPKRNMTECLRPMSAQMKRTTSHQKTPSGLESKKSIESRLSRYSSVGKRRISTSSKSILEKSVYRPSKRTSSEKKFFAVISNIDEDEDTKQTIEKLRIEKSHEEIEKQKKAEFLQSINTDSVSHAQAHSKFMQIVARKKFIYGQKGEIIEVSGKSVSSQLKKVSTLFKSRVQCVEKSDNMKSKIEDDKDNDFYIEFKGRQTMKATSRNQEQKQNEETHEKKFQKSKSKSQKKVESKAVNNNKSVKQQSSLMQSKRQGEEVKSKSKRLLFYNSTNSVYRVKKEAQKGAQSEKIDEESTQKEQKTIELADSQAERPSPLLELGA